MTGSTNAAPTSMPAMATQMPPQSAGASQSVKVSDQPIANDTVTVADVVSSGPGWLVIHADNAGKPGDVIGYTAVKDGDNPNVVVKIDTTKATPVLYAMLHVDAGVVGKYEFPGADVPVMVSGQMITPAFHVTGGLGTAMAPTSAAANPGGSSVGGYGGYGNNSDNVAPTAGNSGNVRSTTVASGSEPVVAVANNPKLGNILVGANGMSLYTFKPDAPGGKSVCTGGCAENWPPLLTTTSVPTNIPGIPGTFGTINRTDNGVQVTYNNMPLYYFIQDKAAGDVNGQGVGGVWFVAVP